MARSDHRLVVGAEFDPTRDEMFLAAHGCGTTLNRRPLRASENSERGQSMRVASLPVATSAEVPAVRRFLKLIPQVQTIQRTGSAALNLAYIAAGRVDGFWSTSLKPWDMAGGVLLLREADGLVTQIDGSEFAVEEPNLLATNGSAIHQELIGLLP